MNEQMHALSNFLEKSEWMPLQELIDKQRLHFHHLLNHAYETVPFYKQYYSSYEINKVLQHGDISDLPIVYRNSLQGDRDNYTSQEIPELHGACYQMETSGSTGRAVKILTTDFTSLFYDALMLREHAWHQRDFSLKLMAILWAKKDFAYAPEGHYQDNWGPPINKYKTTGPSIFINIASATHDQIRALLLYKPSYLMTYPSQLVALAEFCLENQIQLPFIRGIRTTGEILSDTCIKLVKEAWSQADLSDVYSCVEIGNIAQQCSQYKAYHINMEHVLVEIVDDNNQPCALNEPGRVLLTSLLNYATPLIRYEVGDYAEWGEPCPCGRSLPVIKKILGRTRNRLIMPNGESRFPYLGEREDSNVITSAVRKFQFIQHSVNDIEVKIVVTEPLTFEQQQGLIKNYKKNIGSHFNFKISFHDDIPKGPTGKYEEFISFVNRNDVLQKSTTSL